MAGERVVVVEERVPSRRRRPRRLELLDRLLGPVELDERGRGVASRSAIAEPLRDAELDERLGPALVPEETGAGEQVLAGARGGGGDG